MMRSRISHRPTPASRYARGSGTGSRTWSKGLSDADVQPKPLWLERKKAYFRRLENEPEEIVFISAADKLHNARAILADYIERGDELWTRFSIKDQGALPQV